MQNEVNLNATQIDINDTYQFEGIWISRKILENSNLTMTDKLYLSVFYETNSHHLVKKILKNICAERTLIESKRRLISLNLISNINKPEEAKEYTIKYSHSGRVCEWCGNSSYILHQHHYPVPKCKNGTETVNICPTCHETFHNVFNCGGDINE